MSSCMDTWIADEIIAFEILEGTPLQQPLGAFHLEVATLYAHKAML